MWQGWRERAREATRAAKLVTPWETTTDYHLEKGNVVASFARKTVGGIVVAEVTSRTGIVDEYRLTRGESESIHESLADAMSEADARLEAEGYEVVGRVLWIEGGRGR